MNRPHPGNDLPEVLISFDNFAEVRHRPNDSLRALSSEAQSPERIARTETACAKGDNPEQSVVVITVNPYRIGQWSGYTAPSAAAMAAITACSHVSAIAFLGDAGEV
jgi:hypothetical protein